MRFYFFVSARASGAIRAEKVGNVIINFKMYCQRIQYLYNAVGAKQKKVVTDGTVITITDYLNGFQYQNNVLEFFPHAEGYVKYTERYYNYAFNYTDHLGNVRLSYAQDPNGFATRVLEETDEGGSPNTKTKYSLVR